ncbi:MAG: hypothetical protein ABIZ80_06880, partial [Bryobacteraceae bacterium]
VIHPVAKFAGNPIIQPVRPWEGQYTLLYGTVLRDEEEGIWKAWYSTMNHFRYTQHIFPESTFLCYATSRDGIHWEKPTLGVVDYRGTNENNILLTGTHQPELGIEGILDSVSVLQDGRDPDRSRRYKLMIWRHNQKIANGKMSYVLKGQHRMGYYVAFSPDGIHWKERPEPVFDYNPVRDTMALMWDPRASKYVAFIKQGVDGKRARFISESDDFIHWSKPAQILAADAQDAPGVELYNNMGFPYEGMYLGLLTVFHTIPLDNIYLDIELISSRNGRQWQRTGDRTPFIPVGRRNIDWDFGFHTPSSGPPVRVGDELWFYYSGRSYRHPVDGQGREPNHGAIGLAKLRLDGFVSMTAAEAEGALVTRPLQFQESGLFVNAEAARGELRVEVQDESGVVIPGFAKSDCLALNGDGVRQAVQWRSGSNLASLRGKAIRLKFYLRNASLYSFAIDAI